MALGSVTVVGLGLMGGSLCRAIKAAAPGCEVIGVDPRAAEGALALEAGAIDRYEADLEGAVVGADLVVVATPLGVALDLFRTRRGALGAARRLTDMVSVKAPVQRAAEDAGLSGIYVGAHPICGGTGSGFSAGRADLFEGASVWLCAGSSVTDTLKQEIEGFWASVGGRIEWSEAQDHDRRMAWVSHLPQLVANALAGALDSAGFSREELGPGGRDMTRLAGSNPEIWKDLLEVSAPVTGVGITSVSNALNVLADLLARREIGRIAEFMERTRTWVREEAREDQ